SCILLSLYYNTLAPTPHLTLSLHDALPIYRRISGSAQNVNFGPPMKPKPLRQRLDLLLVERGLAESPEKAGAQILAGEVEVDGRSEEHTSELQSRFDLVCRLLLEKKKHI